MTTLRFDYIIQRSSTILATIVLTLTLLAAITGILLSFYYEPTAGGAFNSLATITTEIPNGWLVRSLHNIAGKWLVIVALIQLVVMFLGRRFQSSWFSAWVTGVFVTIAAMGLSWTATILDWSQLGYWRFKIELGTIESIPAIGPILRQILTGGSFNTITVQHMYTLHSYVLAVVAISLAIVHLVSLVQHDRALNGKPAESPDLIQVTQPTAES